MDYINNICEERKILSKIKKQIEEAFLIMLETYKNGGKVLVCGNGGSSADSGHIMAELMKGFKQKRTVDLSLNAKLLKVINKYAETDTNIISVEKHKEFIETIEQGLPTIDITAFKELNTAFSNDKNEKYAFANAILGLSVENDLLFAISTSGKSENIINACIMAKAKGMRIVSLTGRDGGLLKNLSDVSIIVPLNETYKIQEEHMAIYHALCLQIESQIFNKGD